MCGICGVVSSQSGVVDKDSLERMRDSMVHRGPDGAGVFVEEGVGLGHRRLSIVDVAHGHQPMFSEDARYVIVYNGEVFNHPEWQPRLEAEGVRYRTRSDTETVLHLFEKYGDETAKQLRGMFAIAIWDRNRRRLWLARDRFGVKPIYYTLRPDGSLYFASEIKALLSGGAVKAQLNHQQLPDFLANHAPSGVETLFDGIHRLPAGHFLVWENGQISISRYWDLSYSASTSELPNAARQTQLVEEYRERLTEAVRLRLMSDVPLGMFLSGGIDSAALTALMSGMVSDPIRTFSVAFAEREANELSYARMVADRYQTEHREVVVTPDEFWSAVPSLIWHEDEPIAHPSSVALNFVSRLAAQHVKVVLTGEGSDETLAGYNRYRVTVFNQRFGRLYEQYVPTFARDAVRGGVRRLPRSSRLRQKAERTFAMRGSGLDELYFENFAVFPRDDQRRLLTDSIQQRLGAVDPYDAYHRAIDAADGSSLLSKLLYADTKTYLHELLMKQDQMSMAASIESRVPYLDHPLVEWVASLPEPMKLRGVTTKWILREAMKPLLPEAILSRKKMGFPVPIGAWLRGPWSHLMDEYILSARIIERGLFAPAALDRLVAEHRAGLRNHAERLWALITFEMWQRIFLDGEDASRVHMSHASAA